jgi:twitching motility protein PilT
VVAALVDSINKQQGGYIVTLERQIRIVHENRLGLISQREVRGTTAEAASVASAALREGPDVLVIDDLISPEVIQIARELLLATSAVASLISEGQIAQLAVAMDSGRKHGMVRLNDALLGLVRSGLVDPREVYRKADDRPALLSMLKREGVDPSFIERLA